ncbi:MAG: prevent-host-death protein [Pseudomonadota bacterium]
MARIQYVLDEHHRVVGIILPIRLWHELRSERETAYLLKSEKMKERLLAAKKRKEGIPFEMVCERLGT